MGTTHNHWSPPYFLQQLCVWVALEPNIMGDEYGNSLVSRTHYSIHILGGIIYVILMYIFCIYTIEMWAFRISCNFDFCLLGPLLSERHYYVWLIYIAIFRYTLIDGTQGKFLTINTKKYYYYLKNPSLMPLMNACSRYIQKQLWSQACLLKSCN